MDSSVKWAILIGVCLAAPLLHSQNRTVEGTVTDEQGFPLYEANVIVQGTNRGTITNVNGFYQIEADSTDVLEISFIGFAKTLVQIGDQTVINVSMQQANELDEVVVIGYGTTTRVRLTDNIAKVNSDQIKEIPTPSIQATLVGKSAGVQVTQTGGRLESGFKIRVRGVTTITGNQEPLYVIDGIPIINVNTSANFSPLDPLIGLNYNDIESIEILKDASAAAIYGARGTNGVVLITTKKGQKGKTKVSFRSAFGFSEASNRRDFLNTPQYVELFTEAAINSGFTEDDAAFFFNLFAEEEADWRENRVDTDWQDLAFVNGNIQDYGLDFSGGSDNTTYFVSLGYNRTEGILRGNTLERYNLRVNLDHVVNDWLRIGTNSSLSKTQLARLDDDNDFATPLQAIAQIPFNRPFDDEGEPNPNTLYYNFLFQETNARQNTNIWRALLKVYGEAILKQGLTFRSELGYDFNSQSEDQFFGSQTLTGSATNGFGIGSSVQNEKYVWNNYFSYDLNKDQWDLNAVLGMSYEEDIIRSKRIEGQNFPSDDLPTLISAGEITGGNTFETAFSFVSYFARASASLYNKFLFKASIRVDGSSRFGANQKYGTFPALSAGWVISEESFLQDSNAISNLKLRASWGLTGNAEIGNFVSRTNFETRSYNLNPGLVITSLGDPNLSWEDTEQFNVGLDFGFLDNRLLTSLDYYNKNTDGILLNRNIPSTNGIRFIAQNAGSIKNEGVEFTLESQNFVKENFRWNTSINVAYNKNRVVSLPEGADFFLDYNIFREGEAASSFFLVEYAGVDPDNGDALFFRNTELPDGSIDRSTTNDYGETQRVILGNPFPDVIAGMTNTFLWKGFDFSFVFQGEWGASRYNFAGIYQSANADFFDNQTTDQLNRWQQPGDITRVPEARLFGANGTQESSRYLEEADFIRLRDLTLGYSLPANITSKLNLSRLRFFFSGLNLLTITNYSGWDPESTADFFSNDGAFNGLDFYSPPQPRTLTFGINVDF